MLIRRIIQTPKILETRDVQYKFPKAANVCILLVQLEKARVDKHPGVVPDCTTGWQ